MGVTDLRMRAIFNRMTLYIALACFAVAVFWGVLIAIGWTAHGLADPSRPPPVIPVSIFFGLVLLLCHWATIRSRQ